MLAVHLRLAQDIRVSVLDVLVGKGRDRLPFPSEVLILCMLS